MPARLPAELPLDEQDRLVKGFSCWLREEFSVAVHHVVHAPTLYNAIEEKRLWRDHLSREGMQELQDALFDPAMSNLNFHAHIRFTTRKVDRKSGTFGAKTRELDDRKTGPAMLLMTRAEWQRRTNQALALNGWQARIDLRSYQTMIADSDAPEGFEPQEHLVPRTTQKARAAAHDATARAPLASIERAEVRERNKERWNCWLTIRALEREKARLFELSLRREGWPVDVKQGGNAYVVGPRSIRPDGGSYAAQRGVLGATAMKRIQTSTTGAVQASDVREGDGMRFC